MTWNMNMTNTDMVLTVVYGLLVFLLHFQQAAASSRWSLWWNYQGISGPSMWGNMNSDWYMCNKGRNQSPIDIKPDLILYDPMLKNIEIEGDMLLGTLINNGVDLTLEVNASGPYKPVNISIGPLSYKYTVSQIKLHFGSEDSSGSEHSVDEHFFSGEVHIIAYNSDVYRNLSQAQKQPRGVAIIAAFLQIGHKPSDDFSIISDLSRLVLYKGQQVRLKKMSLLSLLPSIANYITYEGSLTQPGCYETVTWIILNRPIPVSKEQMEALRNLRQRDINYPQAFMADNRRPIMPLHRRAIRTNINFKPTCTMEHNMQYQYNTRQREKK